MTHRRTLALAALLVPIAVSLPAAGCTSPGQAAKATVERYMAAIQQRDDRVMARFWAPFRRETSGLSREEQQGRFSRFQEMIQRAHGEFEAAKESGMLPPDPLGVAMFRALRLGKGAISVPVGVALEEDGRAARVRTRLITNLDNLQIDSLPMGVRVYLMGFPLGRLEMVAVGYEKLEDKRLLGSVDIEWRLSRAPEEVTNTAGWLIESIAADPESAAEWRPGRR